MSDCAILPQDDRSPGVQPGAGRTERVLTGVAVADVTVLTALGWVLSYTAIRQLALSASIRLGRPRCGRSASTCSCSWPRWRPSGIAGARGPRRTPGRLSGSTLRLVAGNVTAAGADHMPRPYTRRRR
jgi:hypothetical protein